ncbi:MAG: pseudouridine synthase [Desulfamplus sp.]|nr:pseudouridine synthase [Desulfamplus sp.]
MSISRYSSVVTLPGFNIPGTNRHDIPLVLDFLSLRFPGISKDVWQTRIKFGKVLDTNGNPLTLESLCVPHSKVYYFREVNSEPVVPFSESIIFQNEHLLVADKPHFLPVIPGGSHVNESLLNRLKIRTGILDLVPVHRIDMETAGLVLFSVEKKSRGLYQKLFMAGKIRKSYMALTHCPISSSGALAENSRYWIIKNRIVQGDPWFRMKIDPAGMVNSITRVETLEIMNNKALLRLLPETGKKHQLRLHLSSEGCPIVNDRFYPELLPKSPPDFNNPLQLLAYRLEFMDPVLGHPMDFISSFTIGHHDETKQAKPSAEAASSCSGCRTWQCE